MVLLLAVPLAPRGAVAQGARDVQVPQAGAREVGAREVGVPALAVAGLRQREAAAVGAGVGSARSPGPGLAAGGAMVARGSVDRSGAIRRDEAVRDSVARRGADQLRFCYQERGLKLNPDLAGELRVLVAVEADGRVSRTELGSATWSGAGAAEASECVRRRVAAWRFPPPEAGAGVAVLSFRFSR